jgi:sialic acid synthase SpsE
VTHVSIGSRRVGPGEPLYFIADIGANHDGDLDRAYRLIELAAEAGADAAKFQNFIAPKIVSQRGFEELGAQIAHQSAWERPVHEVYEAASLPQDWTPLLANRCREVGVDYFTSPYDLETVDAVDPHVPAFKVGSGDITWLEILRHIAAKGKPVLLATGASSEADVDRALLAVREHAKEIVLLQCNTNYTGDPENIHHVNLGVLRDWAVRHPDVVLGLSDHTPGHLTVCAAVALGARVFEKHFTDDNERSGPDHAFAMTPRTWREMVDAARATDAALGDGVKRIESNELDAAVVQRRALRFARDLETGHRLGPADVYPTRPCPPDGIPPYRLDEVLGRALSAPAAADGLVRWEALSPARTPRT